MTTSSDRPLGKRSLKSLKLKLAYGRDMGYESYHMTDIWQNNILWSVKSLIMRDDFKTANRKL